MKLYNALTQQVETFTPQSNQVTIYVCGVTPYDTTHLGHAFTYTSFDILIRYLEAQGYQVRYVQNVTDIDDDILRKAKEVGEDWRGLGNRWTGHFIEDMQTLNVRPPDYYPRATDVIPEIIASVERLIELGLAYEAGGSVYYRVDKWPEFGKLSHIPRADMLPVANERGNRPNDPHKQDPLDFVLWQAAAPGEPTWASPWGLGRPGWHIECSTMSSKFLGQTLDIHGGGADLIFPHHECEIAQAEPILREENPRAVFTHFWLHTAMVHHEGDKMSKSLGNLIMVRNLLKSYSPDALRLYLGSYHYRQIWSYEADRLAWAERLGQTLTEAVTTGGGSGEVLDPQPNQNAFQAAMANDLETPLALEALAGLADDILAAARAGRDVTGAQTALRQMSQIFGLRLEQPQPEPGVMQGWREHLKRFS